MCCTSKVIGPKGPKAHNKIYINKGHVDIFEKSACRGFIIWGFFDIAQTKITVIKLVLVMKVRRGIIWAKKDKGTGVGLNKGWLRIIHSICFWWTVFYSIGRSRSRKLLWRRRRRRKGLWRICGVGFLCLQRVQYIYNIPILDKNPYIYIFGWYLNYDNNNYIHACGV